MHVDAAWEACLQRLLDSKEAHGDVRVPINHTTADGRRPSRWPWLCLACVKLDAGAKFR